MVCKSIYIDKADPALFKETFEILSTARQDRIRAMKSESEQKNAIASEFLARECLSELTEAPKFAFNILTGINKLCLVGNFSAYFSLSQSDAFLCCAADRVPVGIDCRRIVPFRFSETQTEMSDSEIRHIYAPSVRFFSDIVRLDICDIREEMQQYWKVRTMKEAYFTAKGRTFRNMRDVTFDFSGDAVQCSDPNFSYRASHLSSDENYIFSVVTKNI